MATYQLTKHPTLPISLPERWRFFSVPLQLKMITQECLGLEILDDLPHHIYPGMIIRYRVRPLFGLPVTWVTEISQVQEPTLFVDEQRVGPYALWHHQHHFRQVESGIEATDIVTFKLHFGFLGTIAYHLFVRKRLNDIFEYRYQVLQKRFGHPIQTSKQ